MPAFLFLETLFMIAYQSDTAARLCRNIYKQEISGTVSLNFNEIKCLEITLYFLTEQLYCRSRHAFFMQLQHCNVQYLEHWIISAKARLRTYMRAENTNSIDWPVTEPENTVWLISALEHGLKDSTIISMAVDEANYNSDMEKMAAKTAHEYALADSIFDERFHTYHLYFSQFVSCGRGVAAKLRRVLNS